MKQSKRIQAVCLAFALILTMGNGLIPAKTADAAKTPKLSKKQITLKVGQKKTLKVKYTKKKVTWSSSKKKIATVSKKGVVRAKKAGKATITAKVGKKKFKCKVTVKAKSTKVTPKPTKKPSVPSKTSSPQNPEPTKPSDNGKPGEPGGQNPAAPTGAPGASSNPGPTAVPTAKPTAKPTATPNPNAPLNLTASKGSGTYPEAFTLSLSNPSGASIYYTTDGSNPVTSSTRKTYSNGIQISKRTGDKNVLSAISPNLFTTVGGPFQVPSDSDVDKCTVIRAVAIAADGTAGEILTNTYFIEDMSKHISGISKSVQASGQDLAVISITMDKNDLFDNEKGIYVIGSDSDNPNFKNKGREWERNCHIDFFETNGTDTSLKLAQDCGIRIQGNYSRGNVQKSFRFYAREDYGVKNFKYPFFPSLKNAQGETMDKFKTLVVRDGGNDIFNYKYKDIFMQSFLNGQQSEALTGRPCVVYLDGEYWGYYILQDDFTDNYLQEKRGVVKENVVIYKGTDDSRYKGYKLDEGELPAGETEDYYLRDTLNYLKVYDLSNDSDYQTFIDKYMCEESALLYYASMIYLNNRYDWPGKNWCIWRTTAVEEGSVYGDGRWRFMFNDLDLTTNTTWNGGNNLEGVSEDQIGNLNRPNSSSIIPNFFGHLMKNAGFRAKLKEEIKRMAEEVFKPDTVSARGDQYLASYSPLHDQFLNRFPGGWSIALSNHNGNIAWLNRRPDYTDTLLSKIDAIGSSGQTSSGGSNNNNDKVTNLELKDNRLIWRGTWARYDASKNVTSAKTSGFSTSFEGTNFISVIVDQSIWRQYKRPRLKLTVDTQSMGSNARCHVWDNGNSMNQYYYLEDAGKNDNSTVYPWTTTAIDISKISSGEFMVNVNDSTLTQFEIYDE